MANILSLPSETIYEIGVQLESRDNRSLRLVCHQISVAIESLALSKLYIDINRDFLDNTCEQLKEFTGQSRGFDYVRTVVIYNSHKTDQEHRTSPSREIPIPVEGIQALYSHLFTLASSNVRALSWFTNPADPYPLMNIVVQYVAQQRISDLSLDLTGRCHFKLPVALGFIWNLEKLRYKTTFKIDRNLSFFMSRALSKVIRCSPHLSHLEVDTGHFLADADAPSLHDILPSISDQPPIPLKTLSLHSVRTLLDQSTLYHLRSLESLSIHSNFYTEINGSHLPQIWMTLRTESICLTRVEVSLINVDDALLDYLLSYKGLRELIFDNSARLWSNNKINVVAHRFFSKVLPKLSGSLEILHLETILPGVWCFGKHNASVIAQCNELRELTVSVADLVQIHSQETLALLDQTASRLPKLRYLRKVNVASVPQIG